MTVPVGMTSSAGGSVSIKLVMSGCSWSFDESREISEGTLVDILEMRSVCVLLCHSYQRAEVRYGTAVTLKRPNIVLLQDISSSIDTRNEIRKKRLTPYLMLR